MTAAVVLHYERIPLTAECCKSLVAQSEPARVLVVDNGSPSHGEAELKAAWFRTGHRIFLRKWYAFPRLRALPPFLAALAWHLARGRFALAAGSAKGYFKPVSATAQTRRATFPHETRFPAKTGRVARPSPPHGASGSSSFEN